ncbi:hypothetical protein C8R47DRAFT_1202766 [Mycena vitilis]|nr:hypothetical protein C8R47DRAFT_1202766 [Mycena vitilis]
MGLLMGLLMEVIETILPVDGPQILQDSGAHLPSHAPKRHSDYVPRLLVKEWDLESPAIDGDRAAIKNGGMPGNQADWKPPSRAMPYRIIWVTKFFDFDNIRPPLKWERVNSTSTRSTYPAFGCMAGKGRALDRILRIGAYHPCFTGVLNCRPKQLNRRRLPSGNLEAVWISERLNPRKESRKLARDQPSPQYSRMQFFRLDLTTNPHLDHVPVLRSEVQSRHCNGPWRCDSSNSFGRLYCAACSARPFPGYIKYTSKLAARSGSRRPIEEHVYRIDAVGITVPYLGAYYSQAHDKGSNSRSCHGPGRLMLTNKMVTLDTVQTRGVAWTTPDVIPALRFDRSTGLMQIHVVGTRQHLFYALFYAAAQKPRSA